MTEAHLRPELPIPLSLQGLNQDEQCDILLRVRLRDDTRRFVSKDRPVVFPCPFKLDRPTEASFSFIQPGEPVFVQHLFPHWPGRC